MARNKKRVAIPLHRLDAQPLLQVHLRKMGEPGPAEHVTHAAHRDDYYIFLFQTQGESRLMVDFNEVVLTGPCLYYLLPGQVHHYTSCHDVSGWLLATEPRAMDGAYRQVFEEVSGETLPVVPDAAAQQGLDYCLEALNSQLQQPREGPLNNAVVSHLVAAYTGLFAGLCLAAAKKPGSIKDRPAEVTKQFRTLLKENYLQEKRPAAYAALLHLSPAYLNECVKSVTGKPVGHWIQQEILLEAKRLLVHTALSSKEIAYQLGYDDPAYFARLFYKSTGITAARFRKAYRG